MAHANPGLSVNTGRVPPIISFAQKKVTLFQVQAGSFAESCYYYSLSAGFTKPKDLRVEVGRLVGQGYRGKKGKALLGFHFSAGAPLVFWAACLLQLLC